MKFKEWLLNEIPVISIGTNKSVLADDQPLKELDVDAIQNNLVVFRVPPPEEGKVSFFADGKTWVYFLDSEKSAQEMKEQKIPMLMVPQGTIHSGGSPITDIWKRRFFKKGSDEPREMRIGGRTKVIEGTDKILGVIEGTTNDEVIYIDMMTVRPPFKRNTINTKMIQALRQDFPKAKIEFSRPTPQGQKFIDKSSSLIS
jgi:hypothetical protein